MRRRQQGEWETKGEEKITNKKGGSKSGHKERERKEKRKTSSKRTWTQGERRKMKKKSG